MGMQRWRKSDPGGCGQISNGSGKHQKRTAYSKTMRCNLERLNRIGLNPHNMQMLTSSYFVYCWYWILLRNKPGNSVHDRLHLQPSFNYIENASKVERATEPVPRPTVLRPVMGLTFMFNVQEQKAYNTDIRINQAPRNSTRIALLLKLLSKESTGSRIDAQHVIQIPTLWLGTTNFVC